MGAGGGGDRSRRTLHATLISDRTQFRGYGTESGHQRVEGMSASDTLTRAHLKTPKAAAIADVVSSGLLIGERASRSGLGQIRPFGVMFSLPRKAVKRRTFQRVRVVPKTTDPTFTWCAGIP
jgi:hypothetical protein